ncbi:SPFH domain-containing protein [Nocardia brasiliensis]|uniref:SPFH domain-containing protein n=1 Tax=Nocardia brasiliensis TaxID=37326 RepID=UPI00379DEFF6
MAALEEQPVFGSRFEQNQLVYKCPELVFARDTEVVVQASELLLIAGSAHHTLILGPGRYHLDTLDLPRVALPDQPISEGSGLRAELYFVTTHALSGIKFGGPLADVVDPDSEQVVSLRVFGEFSPAIHDVALLIAALAGGASPAGTVTELRAWCSGVVLKTLKVTVTQGISCGQWAVLELSAHAMDIEALVVQHVNSVFGRYGLQISALGYFDVTLAPRDAERLKQLALDLKYLRLTGTLSRLPDPRAVGADTGYPDEQPARENRAHLQKFCANCGSQLTPNARFCGMCGTPVSEQ